MGRLNDISLATQVAVFGNKRAFDQLVRQYQSPVRRFFLSQTLGDEMLSDDLAQDTFLKAFTHIGQFRGTSSFLTWLTRIAYNVYYDYRRQNAGDRRLEAGSLSPQTPAPSLQPPNSTIKMDLYTALAQLKEEERTCINLQLVEGFAIDDIAKMTNMPTGTVKSHLKRGKEKMAQYLRQNGYDR